MTRILFVLSSIAMTVAAPLAAREARHHALPPVPQSAEIAALNRESLAKIAPAADTMASADRPTPPPAPAIKKGAHPKR